MKENKKWIYGAIGAMLFIVLVSILAYLKLIPTEIKAIPYYDSVGHFFLFGICGFITEMAFGGAKRTVFNLSLPLGITLIALYAIVDETLQIFSPNRSFDLYDLGFGLLGIMVAYFLSKKLRNSKKTTITY